MCFWFFLPVSHYDKLLLIVNVIFILIPSLNLLILKSGSRFSSADAYIWPILKNRSNLTVVLQSSVIKVLFDAEIRATGVLVSFSGATPIIINSKKEIIISASAVGSPKLLLLSGIGPKKELEALGIQCIVDSPEVGKSLNDHLFLPMPFAPCAKVNGAYPAKLPNIGAVNKHKAENFMGDGIASLCKYLFYGTGPLTSSGYDATVFFKTGLNKDMPFPDMQVAIFCSLADKNFWKFNFQIDPELHMPPAEQRLLEDDGEGTNLIYSDA
jgi:choline dehydrogenase